MESSAQGAAASWRPQKNGSQTAVFKDPEASRHAWAAALRPEFCGSVPDNKPLDAWLIQVISKVRTEEITGPTFCIVGSRILQRILGQRYLNDLERGRDVYHTSDIDIWAKDEGTVKHLIARLKDEISKHPNLVAWDIPTFLCISGLNLYSLRVHTKIKDNKGGRDTLILQSKVDISFPLPPLKGLPKEQRRRALIANRHHETINHASPQVMAEHCSDAPYKNTYLSTVRSLTDIDYLRLQSNILQNSDPDIDGHVREKIVNVVLPLLVYMEVTRRLASDKPKDLFTEELFILYKRYCPDGNRLLTETLQRYGLDPQGEPLRPIVHFIPQPDRIALLPRPIPLPPGYKSPSIIMRSKLPQSETLPASLELAGPLQGPPAAPIMLAESITAVTQHHGLPQPILHIQMPIVPGARAPQALTLASVVKASTDKASSSSSSASSLDVTPPASTQGLSPTQNLQKRTRQGSPESASDNQIHKGAAKQTYPKKHNTTSHVAKNRGGKRSAAPEPKVTEIPLRDLQDLDREDWYELVTDLLRVDSLEKREAVLYNWGTDSEKTKAFAENNPNVVGLLELLKPTKEDLIKATPSESQPKMAMVQISTHDKSPMTPQSPTSEAVTAPVKEGAKQTAAQKQKHNAGKKQTVSSVTDTLPATTPATQKNSAKQNGSKKNEAIAQESKPKSGEKHSQAPKQYRRTQTWLNKHFQEYQQPKPVNYTEKEANACTQALMEGFTLQARPGATRKIKKSEQEQNYTQMGTLLVSVSGHQPLNDLLAPYTAPRLLLVRDETLRNQAIESLDKMSMKESPFRHYLGATLMLQLPLNQLPEQQQRTVWHLIFQAASQGITGAAIELVRLSLRYPQNCPIPTVAAMRILKHCLTCSPVPGADIRLHYRDTDLPCHLSDILCAHIEKMLEKHNQLPFDSPAAFWTALGEEMKYQSQNHANDKHYFIMLAACAYQNAEKMNMATRCHTKLKPDTDVRLNLSQLQNWLLLSMASLKPGEPIQSPLADQFQYYPAIQAIVSLQSGEATTAFNAIQETELNVSPLWDRWLPWCLPLNFDPACLKNELPVLAQQWAEQKERLKVSHQQSLRTTHGVDSSIQAPTVPPGAKSSTLVQPAKAKQCWQAMLSPAIIDKTREGEKSKIKKQNEEFRKRGSSLKAMNHTLSGLLVTKNIHIGAADNHVEKGTSLTAQALVYFGATIDEKQDDIIRLNNLQPSQKGLDMLHEAATSYGNPYAVWIYARLRRERILSQITFPGGAQVWQQEYLDMLTIAACTGVHGAANDLMAEYLDGRADGYMLPLAHFLSHRFKEIHAQTLKVEFPFDSPHPIAAELKQDHSCQNNKDWIKKLMSYPHQPLIGGTLPQLRQAWLMALISDLAQDPDHKSGMKRFIKPHWDIVIPDALQVTISLAREFMSTESKSIFDMNLTYVLKRECYKMILKEKEAEPGFQPELINVLQRQPVSRSSGRIKGKLSDKQAHIDRHMHEIMTLYHCMQQQDKNQPLPLLNSQHNHLKPALLTYQCQIPEQPQFWPVPEIATSEARAAQVLSEDDALMRKLSTEVGENVSETSSLASFLRGRCEICPQSKTIKLKPASRSDYPEGLSVYGGYQGSPYTPAIISLLQEILGGVDESQMQSTFIACGLIQASMNGVEDAARHFARQAFQDNSCISMERVLDCFLAHYQYCIKLQLKLQLPTPPAIEHSAESVIDILSRSCLGRKPGQGPEMSLEDLLTIKIIPQLENLHQKNTTTANIHNKTYLLLCHCYARAHLERPVTIELTKLDLLSPALIHQWIYFLGRIRNDDQGFEGQKAALALFARLPTTKAIDPVQNSGMRSLPYLLTESVDNFTDVQLKTCSEWLEDTQSWLQIPVMMGTHELQWWLDEKPLPVQGDRASRILARGGKLPDPQNIHCYMMMNMHALCMHYCHGQRRSMLAPYDYATFQVANQTLYMYGAEAVMRQKSKISPLALPGATSATTEITEPAPSAKSKKKKKKKHKNGSNGAEGTAPNTPRVSTDKENPEKIVHAPVKLTMTRRSAAIGEGGDVKTGHKEELGSENPQGDGPNECTSL